MADNIGETEGMFLMVVKGLELQLGLFARYHLR
jgi:hypothetical protein